MPSATSASWVRPSSVVTTARSPSVTMSVTVTPVCNSAPAARRRVHQGRVQIAAVGDEVRSAVAGPVLRAEVDLGQHLGGDGVAEHDVLRQHPVGEHLVEQPPRLQDAGAVRSDLQAGADLAELGGPLEQRDLGALAGPAPGRWPPRRCRRRR